MLTEEQRKLVENNMALTSYFINKFHYEYNEVNFSNACIGLVKAALMFNPDKGTKFITYAGQCIRTSLALEYRKTKKRTLEQSMLSLDYDYNDEFSKGIRGFDELVASKENIEEKCEIKDMLNNLEKYLNSIENKLHVNMFKLYYFEHKPQKYISEKYGISQAQVSKICKKLIKDFKKKYNY